ncbi:hypothetical protein NUW54_g2338 [Trametes sanguinea]|uniref:Uncharacterized protein n=1 Tax=Trametes sanguinea TaxID=158606 RepID=A0ACC1Q5Q9_9APHY|nr:hypothetical protein NUW54_g2338 [Trametes sanguinea]
MRFTALLAFVAAISVAAATPAALDVPVAYAGTPDAPVSLSTQSGCGSTGPSVMATTSGTLSWTARRVVTRNTALHSTCQATDATGCVGGDVSHIGSMEVDDPNDTFNVASGTKTNAVRFVCPSIGQVRCEANFNDNYDGPNYSLRVFAS